MSVVQKEFTISNHEKYTIRLTYVEGDKSAITEPQVTNVEIKLTPEKRRQVLCKLADDKINFKNSCYTYALQGFIAKYMGESEHEALTLEREIVKNNNAFRYSYKRHKLEKIKKTRQWATYLHKLSTHFIELEYFVNNAVGDPDVRLDDFEKKFKLFQNNILQDIDDYIITLSDNDSCKHILIKMRENIFNNAQDFSRQFAKIRNNPNKHDLDCLLSIADRAFFIKSLGTFMREEMSFVLDAGIKVSYKISNNRLRDVIQVPRLVAYLSDAEHLFLIKGQSVVEGPKENDTYSPIPKEMLEALTSADPIDDEKELYFSLSPYIKKMHPKHLDEILCLITGKSRDDNSLHGNYFYHFFLQPLKLIASVVEITFSVPRLLAVISLGLVEVIFSPFSSKPNSKKITWKLNQYIIKFFDKFSFIFAPLTYLQNIKASRYERIVSLSDVSDDHQQILDECADYSSYCHKLFRYCTPQLVASSIHEFFISLISSVTNFFTDFKYLLEPARNNDDVYVKVAQRYEAMKLFHEVFGIKSQDLLAQKIDKDSFKNVVYCDSNDVKSPLDVFYEIAVVLSNDVVNPMFRKSPGVATFYFALSMLTFGTLVLPSAVFAWMKPVPTWLQYLANKISLNFTGKPVSAGLMEQSVACFLGWKLGFFSTEFVIEMLEGHYEILAKLFEEPEQIVLGLVGLVGVGMGLQFIPELPSMIKIPGLPAIPNPYFIVINTFTEESKSCAEGTIGLTSIEYGFLGLKFAMLMHSMLSNSEREEAKLSELEKLVLVLQQNDFFKNLLSFCKQKKILNGDLGDAKNDIKTFISEELSKINVIFSDESIDKFATLLISPYKNPPVKIIKKTQPTLAEARNSLRQAIKMVTDKNNKLIFSRSVFGVNKEAHQLYDKLDSLFDDYNAALKREKPQEFYKYHIDKSYFLDIFFNKYIYKRSNNFVRSILIIFYPIPLISRSIKYIWATINHKPSMQHQVIKNFSKDFVILSQIFTPVARMVADFNLYLSGVLRAISFVIVVPVAGAVYPFVEGFKYLLQQNNYQRQFFSKWVEVIDEYICSYIALHKTPALQPFRQLIVRAARIAGVNTNLEAVGDKVLFELDIFDEVKIKDDSYVNMFNSLGVTSDDFMVNNSVSKPPMLTIIGEITNKSNNTFLESYCNFTNFI